MIRIVSWNIAGLRHRKADGSPAPWHILSEMDADIALLQEAGPPPDDIPADRFEIDPSPWTTAGRKANWKAAVVKLSNRVKVDWIRANSIGQGGFEVSRPGTVAAAVVTPADGGASVTVASLYARWEQGWEGKGEIWADGSAHRIISDLSNLIRYPVNRRIIAAGDLNILHGHGEHGNKLAAARYATVFDRMKAVGLPFIGPQYPNGLQAEPWPAELPLDSKNVPTYYYGNGPATATRQLDFVFASAGMKDAVSVRALNGLDEWGPSDHCRVIIEVR